MIQFIPFISWLAAIASGVTMGLLWTSGDLGPRGAAALCVWFLVALYLQMFGAPLMVAAIGLSLQTVLAVYLSIRVKLSFYVATGLSRGTRDRGTKLVPNANSVWTEFATSEAIK